MTKETHRVRIEKPGHVYAMAVAAGLMDAQETLEAMPENLRSEPGFALALATITAEANRARGELIGKSLQQLAKAGVEIARYENVMFDPNTSELICTIHDPSPFD